MTGTLNTVFKFDFVLKSVTLGNDMPATQQDVIYRVPDKLCPYRIPTLEEINRELINLAYRVDKSKLLSDIFECGAIAISNQIDLPQAERREIRYKEIISAYEPHERNKIADIFGLIYALLSSVVYDDGVFDDYLGKLFMENNMSNSGTSQFFTPFHISNFCAKVVLDESIVKEKIRTDGILTIDEPCCGSGSLALAAVSTLKDYGLNYARNSFFVCEDIDARCAHMCYLQLSLAGVPAIVKQQNSLTGEIWQVWKTPAFIFQYPRFAEYENS